MKLYFHISKTGNLFHFISNLTSWHFSVRPSYKKYWIEKTGPLSKEDEIWLSKAEKLFKKYSFGNKYWGKIFLRRPDKDVWSVAQEWYKKDAELFKKIADYFESRFSKIWPEEEKLLIEWKNKLSETQNKATPTGLKRSLDSLFLTKVSLDEEIKIVLLMSSPGTKGAGGANIGKGAITEELSRTPKEAVKMVWLNFWHEIIHVYWEKSEYYQNLLSEFMEKNDIESPIEDIPFSILLKEAVLESFIPQGYLAKKYFNFPSKDVYSKNINDFKTGERPMQSMIYWRNYSLSRLINHAKSYVESNKSIDETYFNKVVSVLKDFKTLITPP